MPPPYVPTDAQRQALDQLELAAAGETVAELTTEAAVRAARDVGAPWPAIAAKFGVTRQTAWARWHHLDPKTQGDPT